MKFTYSLVNLGTILIPFVFSFHPKIKFHTYFFTFLKSASIPTLIFVIWDAIFTHMGVWGFNPTYIVNINIYNLPIEEILFFYCIPFSCLFTYFCLNKFYKITWLKNVEIWLVTVLALFLIILGFYHINSKYTFYSLVSTGILLLYLEFIAKVSWLPKILSIYPLLLIPFFIVNGILTGTGLESPVVWYNNAENLGIRMITIPFEDIFYGLELILLNIYFFERFKIQK